MDESKMQAVLDVFDGLVDKIQAARAPQRPKDALDEEAQAAPWTTETVSVARGELRTAFKTAVADAGANLDTLNNVLQIVDKFVTKALAIPAVL